MRDDAQDLIDSIHALKDRFFEPPAQKKLFVTKEVHDILFNLENQQDVTDCLYQLGLKPSDVLISPFVEEIELPNGDKVNSLIIEIDQQDKYKETIKCHGINHRTTQRDRRR